MDTAVIVAGAGPAGLMLAGELRLAGVPVIVLDRLAGPTGESRGLGFNARTMEVFDQRGILPRFGNVEISTLGHFGGIPVDFSLLDGAHYGVKNIAQSRVEKILAEWATELGADIRRGWEVTDLTDEGEYVRVSATGPTAPAELRAQYLIGCDGGRSTVRGVAGFGFPGTAATRELYLADIRGGDIAPRPIGETVPGGMVMSAPLGDGVDRIIVSERGAPPRRRTEPPSYAEVADAWQRLTGQDISRAAPVWVSSFGDAARQADTYRRGRVLLAGDAAHIHLPAGGQGLNVSVQDAVNLGWKLASVVEGRAPDSLLDTYHEERHPVGSRLLANTQAQGMLFLTGAETRPLREVTAELIAHDEVARHLIGMVSGLDIRYGTHDGGHPLLGMRLPPWELVVDDRKTTSAELLHPARGIVLELDGGAAGVREAAAPWTDRVDVVTATPHDYGTAGPIGLDALVIRPDGHVAWVAPGPFPLTETLDRWFGPPRGPEGRQTK
ncbi:FAD-dependent monooxygenase [Streptomyces anulatus]|uniref:FAD-dependent monooxygenase n=1 Tax=Streptomyces anulatus TaxID=1892 RepID=UPI003643930C